MTAVMFSVDSRSDTNMRPEEDETPTIVVQLSTESGYIIRLHARHVPVQNPDAAPL